MSSARPLWWFERPGVAAAVMPQRPCWYQRYSRYCCATVRNALLIWIVLFAVTFISAVFAGAPRYGRTAFPVIVRFPPGVKRVRLAGFMQLISSAICLDKPSTTAVVQPEDV